MTEICIPVPSLAPFKRTEFELHVEDNGIIRYRIECVPVGETEGNNTDISGADMLKKVVDAYDKNWELIQLFNTSESRNCVYALYREKNPNSLQV